MKHHILSILADGTLKTEEKGTKKNKEVHKVKCFPCALPDLITAPTVAASTTLTFRVRHAFKSLSYSQRSIFFEIFCFVLLPGL